MGAARAAMAREARQGLVEHLQAKYVGTGHSDLSKHEWAVNQHRDSYASYLGHTSMLAYFALAHGESQGRLRYNFMQKMVAPCGPKPTEAANQLVADLAPSAQQKRAAMDEGEDEE